MMNILRIPDHQSCDATDLVTDVHWNPVQRSDVHNTNASTSEYAQKTSSVDGKMQRSHVQKINASIDVLTLAAYGGCCLRQYGRKTTSTDDGYAAHPRSSITASSDDHISALEPQHMYPASSTALICA
jgi:hypothetical protein